MALSAVDDSLCQADRKSFCPADDLRCFYSHNHIRQTLYGSGGQTADRDGQNQNVNALLAQ